MKFNPIISELTSAYKPKYGTAMVTFSLVPEITWIHIQKAGLGHAHKEALPNLEERGCSELLHQLAVLMERLQPCSPLSHVAVGEKRFSLGQGIG